MIGALAGVTALVVGLDATLGVPGGVLHGRLLDGSSAPGVSSSPQPELAAQPAPSVLPAADSTTSPDPAAVAATLSPILDVPDIGPGLGAAVIDMGTGAELYSSKPDAGRPPASTVKILTATAALELLGPEARLTTSVVEGGPTDGSGTPRIVLVGGGDPSLRTAPAGGDPSLRGLARATAEALASDGARRVRLGYDASLFQGRTASPAWPETYISSGVVAPVTALSVDSGRGSDPSQIAAQAFADELERAGVDVRGQVRAVRADADAPQLAQVRSQPVGLLLERMLTLSDNDYAEAFGHLVAVAAHEPATFAGGAAATISALDALGLPTDGLRLQDASGLSRGDRVRARTLVLAVALAGSHGHPTLAPVLTGLPVGGFSGTLADRYEDPSSARGAGFVRAKTGTLTGVAALAGMVQDRDGRVLAFAFLVDRTSRGDALGAPAVLDSAAAALARCGCD